MRAQPMVSPGPAKSGESVTEADRIGLLKGLRDLDTPIELRRSFAMTRLHEAGSDEERNAAAIALVDLDERNAVPSLIELVQRSGMPGRAGTLLYAIEELEGSLPFETFVYVIVEGSYEARQQALDLLDAGLVEAAGGAERQQGLRRLEQLRDSSDTEASATAEEALALLRQDGSADR